MKIVALSLLVAVALLAALGNLCFKIAAGRKKQSLLHCMFSLPFFTGGALFLICPVLSIFCAKYIDFSVMYAMTALNFVFILGLSRCFLKEKIDRCKLFGVALIALGVILMVCTEI